LKRSHTAEEKQRKRVELTKPREDLDSVISIGKTQGQDRLSRAPFVYAGHRRPWARKLKLAIGDREVIRGAVDFEPIT
jgi:hypothetical protein